MARQQQYFVSTQLSVFNDSRTKNDSLRFLPISSVINDVINYISGREDVSAGMLPPN